MSQKHYPLMSNKKMLLGCFQQKDLMIICFQKTWSGDCPLPKLKGLQAILKIYNTDRRVDQAVLGRSDAGLDAALQQREGNQHKEACGENVTYSSHATYQTHQLGGQQPL